MRIPPDKWSSRGWRLISLLLLAASSTSAQTAALLEMHLVLGQPSLLVTGAVSSAHTILFTSQLGNSNSWQVLTNIELPGTALWVVDSSATNAPKRFYRAVANPTNMAFIPAGPFVMGDAMNDYPGPNETPLHTVQVSAFCMDKYEVTKALWDEVYNWAITNGYSFEFGAQGKAANHPAQTMTWYDAAKWCNARSEKEGRMPAYYTNAAQTTIYRSGQVTLDNSWVKWNAGYRLPTEAEWEKAARGGASGHRFAWSDADTITHSRANYFSSALIVYDVSPTRGYHPTFNDGVSPYTSPVGYFAANGYGLYDMTANVVEWCWDWYGVGTYSSGSQTDPRGPTSGPSRMSRGGRWAADATQCRTSFRGFANPTSKYSDIGFRSALPLGQP